MPSNRQQCFSNINIIYDNCRLFMELLTETKNSMLHHAKDLMSIFPFIDDAKI